jgi:orotate phosphoribosyltransferase-like protein
MANKYAHLRAKARELRQKGYTLTDIIDMLKMPKTTIIRLDTRY